MQKGGLGRGLGSLIPNKIEPFINPSTVDHVEVFPGERVQQIAVEKIEANPLQPRIYFDHGDLEDLVNSIKKHGILQPLIVSENNGQYQLIAGERRLRAAKILEIKTAPCLIRSVKDLEKLEWALIENIQRADLNPLEEASAYQRLVDDFALTQEEVAEKVGKKRTTVANALRLLSLPQEIQEALRENKITAGHAKVILSAETAEERLRLFKKILQFGLTVRQSEGEVRKVNVKGHQRIVSVNPEIKEKEEVLRQALGTKVSIIPFRSGQGGQKSESGSIDIEYYSQEELNELVRKISQA